MAGRSASRLWRVLSWQLAIHFAPRRASGSLRMNTPSETPLAASEGLRPGCQGLRDCGGNAQALAPLGSAVSPEWSQVDSQVVAKRKLAPGPSECWIVAIAIAESAPARGQKESRRAQAADARFWAKALVRHRRRRAGCGRLLCRHCDSPARAGARTKAVAPSRGRPRSDLGESTSEADLLAAGVRASNRIRPCVQMHRYGRQTCSPARLSLRLANRSSQAAQSKRCWISSAATVSPRAIVTSASTSLAFPAGSRCRVGRVRSTMPGEPRANDTDGYALAAQSGKSQGGHRVSTGSKPTVDNGLPGYVLQESPYPDQPTVSRGSDTTLTE